MLSYPTVDQLNGMRLTGMSKGLRAQLENPESRNFPTRRTMRERRLVEADAALLCPLALDPQEGDVYLGVTQ
jgi:hypothetical protein